MTCADLGFGAKRECRAGIIASCADGTNVRWTVCGDENVCAAAWQIDQNFQCSRSQTPDASVAEPGTADAIDAETEAPDTIRVAEATILADTNGDGAVSPGETAYVRIRVKNTGTSEALGLHGTLTTSTPSVTISDDTLYFDDVAAGASACATTSVGTQGSCGYPPNYLSQLVVGTDVPAGTIISFSLALGDTYGNSFSLSFTQEVAP